MSDKKVSLLAEARGRRPVPSVMAIQDLDGRSAVRLIPQTLDELVQKSLESWQTEHFTLSVYFGPNIAKRHERLARELLNLFQSPLLRFEFSRRKKWRMAAMVAQTDSRGKPGPCQSVYAATNHR